MTGGNSWDNLTADLPLVGAHGVTASSGAIYVATDQGVFYTLNGPALPAASFSGIGWAGRHPPQPLTSAWMAQELNYGRRWRASVFTSRPRRTAPAIRKWSAPPI